MNELSASVPVFRHSGFRGLIGIACEDITPPVGIYARNWGAARHDVASSIHRPLTLGAMALAPVTGESQLVFIDADLGWWKDPALFDTFQMRLLDEFSLHSRQLIFALTHTHSGPPLMETDPTLPNWELNQSWMEHVLETAVSTVRQALEDMQESILEWTTGRCGLAAVRDLVDPNPSSHRMLCGYAPGTIADDTVLVGRITNPRGQIRATLVNYACHPTTLAWENTAISPDYIGAMRETIQQATEAPVFFMLGNCGELAPRYQYVGDPTVADAHGRELGHAALSALAGMEPPATELNYSGAVESGAPLAVWRHQPREVSTTLKSVQTDVELKIKDWPTAQELEQQRLACNDRALEERLRRKRHIRRFLGDGSTFRLPLYLWRLGDAVIVGSRCEAYSVMQLELRARFPNNAIISMNLINGSLGYLPPAELYDADVYTVWQTPFDRGGLELALETLMREIHDILQ